MAAEVVVWILTVSIWSEAGTRVISTQEFAEVSDCVVRAEKWLDDWEKDSKKLPGEYLQATCMPKK